MLENPCSEHLRGYATLRNKCYPAKPEKQNMFAEHRTIPQEVFYFKSKIKIGLVSGLFSKLLCLIRAGRYKNFVAVFVFEILADRFLSSFLVFQRTVPFSHDLLPCLSTSH